MHGRSHSLSAIQSTESPSHQINKMEKSSYGGGTGSTNSVEMQLKYENDRLKLALAQR